MNPRSWQRTRTMTILKLQHGNAESQELMAVLYLDNNAFPRKKISPNYHSSIICMAAWKPTHKINQTTRLTCIPQLSATIPTLKHHKQTSKNRLSHQTWKIPSPIRTASWKMLHHFTRAFVLSAVFRWTRSRRTMKDCSSLTWAKASERRRTDRGTDTLAQLVIPT